MGEVRNSTRQDLMKIAYCHISAFPDSLSSKMGLKYLTKMIDWYLSDEKRFLFHIEEDGKCIGYCGGMINDGTQTTGSASGMIQHSFNDAAKAILLRPWLLFHKELFEKYSLIIKNVKRKFFPKSNRSAIQKSASKKNSEAVTGLVVIGVAKGFQGKGYGSMLLKEFEKKTEGFGIRKMALTVRGDNLQAIKSYELNGWKKGKLEGNSLEMTKDIRI